MTAMTWVCDRCGKTNTSQYRCARCRKKNPRMSEEIARIPCEVCGKLGHREEKHDRA